MTEDIHTSLRVHAKGWRSVFVSEPLAFGLEAQSLREFYAQRRRWAVGSLTLLFRRADSPLRSARNRPVSIASRFTPRTAI